MRAVSCGFAGVMFCLVSNACTASGTDGQSSAPGGSAGSAGSPGAPTGGATASGGADGHTGGRTSTGGETNSGGATTGTGGSTSSVPSGCRAAGATTTLPAGAPALKPGVWKNISPAGVDFHSGGGNDVFTQGVTVDPCNPAVIYLSVSSFDVSGGNPGVYKSTDAGSTWNKVGSLDEPIHVRVDPGDPQHLLAADGVRGATQGLWVSHDGGTTWALPSGWSNVCSAAGITEMCGLWDVYDVAVDPADFDHVLFSFHSPWSWSQFDRGAGIIETTDGGATWIVHAPQAGWGQGHGIWFLSNSSTWLLGTQGAGFWRTSDAGKTWTQVETGSNMQHGGGQIYRSASGSVYAGGTPHLIRSRDDGVTWTALAPLSGYNGIVGDGTALYTAPNTEPGALGPGFITAPESDGATWTEYPDGTVLSSKGSGASGPFEMAFDSANRIVYAGCWGAGLWALKVK